MSDAITFNSKSVRLLFSFEKIQYNTNYFYSFSSSVSPTRHVSAGVRVWRRGCVGGANMRRLDLRQGESEARVSESASRQRGPSPGVSAQTGPPRHREPATRRDAGPDCRGPDHVGGVRRPTEYRNAQHSERNAELKCLSGVLRPASRGPSRACQSGADAGGPAQPPPLTRPGNRAYGPSRA